MSKQFTLVKNPKEMILSRSIIAENDNTFPGRNIEGFRGKDIEERLD